MMKVSVRYVCQTSVICHPWADNVHETSASLISRCVTWGEELGATAGALSRTKHLEQGDTAPLVPFYLAPRQVGVCLLGGPEPPWRGTQHTASTWFHVSEAHILWTYSGESDDK